MRPRGVRWQAAMRIDSTGDRCGRVRLSPCGPVTWAPCPVESKPTSTPDSNCDPSDCATTIATPYINRSLPPSVRFPFNSGPPILSHLRNQQWKRHEKVNIGDLGILVAGHTPSGSSTGGPRLLLLHLLLAWMVRHHIQMGQKKGKGNSKDLSPYMLMDLRFGGGSSSKASVVVSPPPARLPSCACCMR
jgi:hypothetical protein